MGGLCLPIRGLGWEAWVSGKQYLILPKQSPRQQRVLGEIRMKEPGSQTQQVTHYCQAQTNNAGNSLHRELYDMISTYGRSKKGINMYVFVINKEIKTTC